MATFDVIKENTQGIFQGLTAGISVVAWIIIIFILLALIGAITIFILIRRNYKYTIIIFEKINDVWVDTGKDKASEYKYGSLGNRILYWRKKKIYTIFPSERILQNKFYFKRNEFTGEYVPITLKDLSSNQLQLEDRLRAKIQTYNLGIRKGLKDELGIKKGWLMENLPTLISIGVIVVMGVMIWLCLDKVLQISNTQGAIAKQESENYARMSELVGKIDNLLAGGSGIRPVT